jgi:hypothetical protein
MMLNRIPMLETGDTLVPICAAIHQFHLFTLGVHATFVFALLQTIMFDQTLQFKGKFPSQYSTRLLYRLQLFKMKGKLVQYHTGKDNSTPRDIDKIQAISKQCHTVKK